MDHFVARANAKTVSVVPVTKAGFRKWQDKQSKLTKGWIKANGFKPDAGKKLLIPGRDGSVSTVLFGLGTKADVWTWARLPAGLPKGRYALEGVDAASGTDAALGWALATYRFHRYKSKPKKVNVSLVWPEGVDQAEVQRLAEGTALVRDLVNTPAADLGPAEMCDTVRELGKRYGGKVTVIKGKGLLEKGYPAIHAVGRAASRAPALADLRWGNEGDPKVSLVGKGVVFDSGGLDLKSAAGMKLMKKDMGGAASVLGLAHMIMDAGLPVRLRVLIPTVENAVSGDAYRPLDVLQTRKGLTVEVGNTDAEGRLIMCDALAEADTEAPDLLLDFATLTGAARIALGTELPALFCDDDDVANAWIAAGLASSDPLWRMPIHRAYRRHLDSRVADMNNISSVSQGGAITAALFLDAFVEKAKVWGHVDTMAYNNSSRPGRPGGGEAFGVRAAYRMLAERFPVVRNDGDDS